MPLCTYFFYSNCLPSQSLPVYTLPFLQPGKAHWGFWNSLNPQKSTIIKRLVQILFGL